MCMNVNMHASCRMHLILLDTCAFTHDAHIDSCGLLFNTWVHTHADYTQIQKHMRFRHTCSWYTHEYINTHVYSCGFTYQRSLVSYIHANTLLTCKHIASAIDAICACMCACILTHIHAQTHWYFTQTHTHTHNVHFSFKMSQNQVCTYTRAYPLSHAWCTFAGLVGTRGREGLAGRVRGVGVKKYAWKKEP